MAHARQATVMRNSAVVPRPDYRTVPIKFRIRADKADRLQLEAKRRGVKPEDLVQQLVGLIITDNLFQAVLD